MASASVADKSKQSQSDPNRGDGPLATAPSVPNSSPAPLSRFESQKRRDWNTFLQYLRNLEPPVTLAGCSENHVAEFLRYLNQFGKIMIHNTACPFFGKPESPDPCTCPLNHSSGTLEALIGRLGSAYVEHGGLPESNPFTVRASMLNQIQNYREFNQCSTKARGISYKKKEGKRPSKGQGGNTTGTGSDGDGSGSAAQTTSTTTTRKKAV